MRGKLLTILIALSIILSTFSKVKQTTNPQTHQKSTTILKTTIQEKQTIQSKQLNFKYFIFQQKCYDIFFTQHDFLNLHCVKLTLSKVIGYVLVYGSLAVKAPQIIKIVMNKSIVGISFSSIVIEALMNSLLIGYNIFRGNPFSIYGENVFLGVSNLLMIACFFIFSTDRNYGTYIRGTVLLIAISAPLILQLAPAVIIQNSILMSIVAFLLSRVEQVRQNHKNKSTGNLSFLTSFMNFGGNVARTFTVLTEASGDTMFLISNILPIFVNGYILIQFFLYWNNTINYEPVKTTETTTTKKQSKKQA